MSLAQVQVALGEFEFIYQHLISYDPRYLNMHLRERRQRNRRFVLRYLHAMHANVPAHRIDGMISGPGVFWHYQIVRTRQGTQLNVPTEEANPVEQKRILARFVPEVLDRVHSEQQRTEYLGYGKRTHGEYYLKRGTPGPTHHQHCITAVHSAELDRRFVSQLASWNLVLYRG